MVLEHIKDGILKIIVKPNAKKNEILGWDKEKILFVEKF